MPAKGLDLLNPYVFENAFSWNAELCSQQKPSNVFLLRRPESYDSWRYSWTHICSQFLPQHGSEAAPLEGLSSLPVSITCHFKSMLLVSLMGLSSGWFCCRKSVPQFNPLPLPHSLDKHKARWPMLISLLWLIAACGSWPLEITLSFDGTVP